jgi:hypothetical protein
MQPRFPGRLAADPSAEELDLSPEPSVELDGPSVPADEDHAVLRGGRTDEGVVDRAAAETQRGGAGRKVSGRRLPQEAAVGEVVLEDPLHLGGRAVRAAAVG